MKIQDGASVRTPDGQWALWSARAGVLVALGVSDQEILSRVSLRLGSHDKAREEMVGAAARWADALAAMDPDTARAMARRYAVEAPQLTRSDKARSARLTREAAIKARRAEAAAAQQREKAAELLASAEALRVARAAAEEMERALRKSERMRRAEKKARERDLETIRAGIRAELLAARALRQKPVRTQNSADPIWDTKAVALYELFGSYNRVGNLCCSTMQRVRAAVRRAGLEPLVPRKPRCRAEARAIMEAHGCDERTISRALKGMK